MHVLDTERNPAREGQPGAAPQEVATPTLEPKIVDGPQSAKHFSPDPMQTTDRYRLVTPYDLASDDRSGD